MERSAARLSEGTRGVAGRRAGVFLAVLVLGAVVTISAVEATVPAQGGQPREDASAPRRGAAPSRADAMKSGSLVMGDQPAETASEPAARGRLLPPSVLPCTRDHLTAFFGRILDYKRSPGRITIRMRTDESTTERITLSLKKGEDPAHWFLMRGEQFGSEDWARIERGPGILHQGMRAIVWMCREVPKRPLIDWRPAEAEEPAAQPTGPPAAQPADTPAGPRPR